MKANFSYSVDRIVLFVSASVVSRCLSLLSGVSGYLTFQQFSCGHIHDKFREGEGIALSHSLQNAIKGGKPVQSSPLLQSASLLEVGRWIAQGDPNWHTVCSARPLSCHHSSHLLILFFRLARCQYPRRHSSELPLAAS